MYNHWKIITVLFLLALGSAWLPYYWGSFTVAAMMPIMLQQPDDYMYNFVTLTMAQDGSHKNTLEAEYMAHYADETTKLLKPRLKIFRKDKPPTVITARNALVAADNDTVMLSGKTTLRQKNAAGEQELEIITSDVRVMISEEYAETDQPATIVRKKITSVSNGMQAYLKEERIKLLNNVQTVIMP